MTSLEPLLNKSFQLTLRNLSKQRIRTPSSLCLIKMLKSLCNKSAAIFPTLKQHKRPRFLSVNTVKTVTKLHRVSLSTSRSLRMQIFLKMRNKNPRFVKTLSRNNNRRLRYPYADTVNTAIKWRRVSFSTPRWLKRTKALKMRTPLCVNLVLSVAIWKSVKRRTMRLLRRGFTCLAHRIRL